MEDAHPERLEHSVEDPPPHLGAWSWGRAASAIVIGVTESELLDATLPELVRALQRVAGSTGALDVYDAPTGVTAPSRGADTGLPSARAGLPSARARRTEHNNSSQWPLRCSQASPGEELEHHRRRCWGHTTTGIVVASVRVMPEIQHHAGHGPSGDGRGRPFWRPSPFRLHFDSGFQARSRSPKRRRSQQSNARGNAWKRRVLGRLTRREVSRK